MVVFFILLTKIWDDPVFILLSFLCQSLGSSFFSPITKWIISAILPLKARSFKITIHTLTTDQWDARKSETDELRKMQIFVSSKEKYQIKFINKFLAQDNDFPGF